MNKANSNGSNKNQNSNQIIFGSIGSSKKLKSRSTKPTGNNNMIQSTAKNVA